MGFTDAVKNAYKNFMNLDGRTARREFWYFQIYVVISGLIIATVIYFVPSLSFLTVVFDIGMILPGIFISVRRLHDIGKNAAYWFLNLIPVIGTLVLIVWYCRDGEPGENKYGPNPKV